MLFQEFAVAFVVCGKLVIRNNRSAFSYALFDVTGIATMFLSRFFPVSRVRIVGILQHPGVHSSIGFCPQSALSVFNNGLLRQASDKELVFRDFFK